MGICKYCGKPAGIFKSKHKECEEKYLKGKEKIKNLILNYFTNENSLNNFSENLNQIAKDCYITEKELNDLKIKGWKECVSKAFDDGILTEREEEKLMNMAELFNIDKKDLQNFEEYELMVKGAILRDLLNGIIPQRIHIQGNLPFNFQKKEKLIWIFNNVEYYEIKTRRIYTGGYSGFSIRIAKGVYYRVGGFKGNPVNKTETVYIDTGIMAITTKHIYFAGSHKIFRVRYDKIISFIPYSNGIGIQRDAKTAKPQIFITGDGWFTMNLIQNIAKITN